MKKLTAIEYAKLFSISKQAVYQKIKKGVVSVENIDGVKYILVQDDDFKANQTKENNKQDCINQTVEITILQEQIKAKDEKIKFLEKTIST